MTNVCLVKFRSETTNEAGRKEDTIMESTDTNNIGDTIRIRRPPRVFTNERGRTVWMSEVEPAEFELELELDQVIRTDPYDSGWTASR